MRFSSQILNPHRFLILASGFVALALTPVAASGEATAEFSHVVGKVFAGQGTPTRPIARGDILKPGESIKTGKGAMTIITLNEGTKVKINENSEVHAWQLDESAAGGEEVDLALEGGSVICKVIKRKESHFRLHTKSATMGVRGTEFFAGIGHGAMGRTDTWMTVREGVVEVESKASGKKVVVTEGNGTVLPGGKDVLDPKPYAWAKTLNWNMLPGKGSVINKSSLDSASMDLLKRDYD